MRLFTDPQRVCEGPRIGSLLSRRVARKETPSAASPSQTIGQYVGLGRFHQF
jgi:hypothetical protein